MEGARGVCRLLSRLLTIDSSAHHSSALLTIALLFTKRCSVRCDNPDEKHTSLYFSSALLVLLFLFLFLFLFLSQSLGDETRKARTIDKRKEKKATHSLTHSLTHSHALRSLPPPPWG